MNLTRHQLSVRPLTSIAGPRAVIALLVFGAALAASNPAMAQALEPVVRGATIARDTVVAITLLLYSFTAANFAVAGKAMVVQPAQINGRTAYRLRVEGVGSQAEAQSFCAALQAEGTECVPLAQR